MSKDTIYRQAAIDLIMGQPPEPHYPSWYAEQIKGLPPAQPEYKELQKWKTDFKGFIDDLLYMPGDDYRGIMEYIDEVPSAQPERKKGEWIKIPEFCGDDVSGFIDNHFSCSECKKEAEINPWGFYILSDFCPHCGADMRGEEE